MRRFLIYYVPSVSSSLRSIYHRLGSDMACVEVAESTSYSSWGSGMLIESNMIAVFQHSSCRPPLCAPRALLVQILVDLNAVNSYLHEGRSERDNILFKVNILKNILEEASTR